ncbi:MAG: response regulator transcription factor [Actinomycetota bacterium]|nr:response regulator transcription factor [Actinomycetota bacterium]
MGGGVLIVEDHGLLADSLLYALRAEGLDADKISPVTADGILAAARRLSPTVVLLDLDLGGEIGSSVGLIPPLHELGAQVVMVTGITDRTRLAECLEAGATGLIDKATSFDQLVDSVREVADLGTIVPAAQRDMLLTELREQRKADQRRHEPFERLTPREREVLAALMDGKSASVIAQESFVSLATVRSQIRTILMKLDVNSQLTAVAMAKRNGWVLR